MWNSTQPSFARVIVFHVWCCETILEDIYLICWTCKYSTFGSFFITEMERWKKFFFSFFRVFYNLLERRGDGNAFLCRWWSWRQMGMFMVPLAFIIRKAKNADNWTLGYLLCLLCSQNPFFPTIQRCLVCDISFDMW